jgi:hypothetical protein
MFNFFRKITPFKIILLISLGQFAVILIMAPFTQGFSLVFLFFTPIGVIFSLVLAGFYKLLFFRPEPSPQAEVLERGKGKGRVS